MGAFHLAASFRQIIYGATCIAISFLSSALAVAANTAVSVDVVVIQPQDIRSWSSFSGRLVAVENAVIKPRVSGTIQQVLFREGQSVKKGQALFIIDPRLQQAAVASMQAHLASAQAKARLAADDLNRAQQLLTNKLIAQSIYDASLSANQVAQAELLQAQASLTQAKLDLEYAHINAPIDGRASRAELTVGNTVQAGANAPTLTQIIANEKFYADFNVDEATYIRMVRNTSQQSTMPVELTLANDSSVTYQGHLSSFDNQIDTSSGTIRARALFDNVDGALTAGMFANIRLGSTTTTPALLVPERAIGTNQSKKFVWVVDDKNIANYREVSLGDHYNSGRVVLNGIHAGEKVVVNGLSHVKPNAVVNPVIQPAADAPKVVIK